MRLMLPMFFVLLAGCSRPAPFPDDHATTAATPAAAPTPAPVGPDYGGRWTGVEGMFLDVRPGAAPGHVALTMQYDLDHRGSFDATRDGDTLVFTRDGAARTLRPTDGAATGPKYLAGKKDCLTVAPGEGYCRA